MSVAAVEADEGRAEPDATGLTSTTAAGGLLAGGFKNDATEVVAVPLAASRCFLLSA